MEFTPRNPSPTGPHSMRIPSSDETNVTANHNTAKHTRMYFPQSTAYAYAPHSLSPPQDAEQLQPAEYDASPFNKYLGNTVPPNVENGHPPTPPHFEDDIQLLRTWNAQHEKQQHASTPAARHDIANASSIPQLHQPEAANQHSTNGHDAPAGPSYEDVFMKKSSYVPFLRNAQVHGQRARDATAPLQVYPGRDSGSLSYHAGRHAPNDAPLMQQPPVQQWPTHRLGKASRQLSRPHQRARSSHITTAIKSSHGHDVIMSPDPKALAKAEANRRKAEAVRQRRQARINPMPPPKPPTPSSTKRKAAIELSDNVSLTLPPFLRHPPHTSPRYGQPPPQYSQPSMHSTGYGYMTPGPPPQHYDPRIVNEYAPSPHYKDTRIVTQHASHPYTFDPSLVHQQRSTLMSHGPATISTLFQSEPLAHAQSITFTPNGLPQMTPDHLQYQPSRPGLPFRPSSAFQSGVMSQPTRHLDPAPLVVLEPQPVDWDESPQEIVSEYGDYKWSITHYQVVSNGTYGAYDFAQSWLDDLYASNNLLAPRFRWHTHSTQGFIEGGTRTSFIVLHNATNPFESDSLPSSTTSIGVYGHDWYDHTTIHWTTFAPDIRWLLRYCESVAQNIRVKQKWTVDMPKASEKRFHRAYWLAATRNPLGGLLKRGPSNDVPHDAVEDDEPFDFTEEDLSNEWDNTIEESEEAWKRVKEEIKLAGDKGITGHDHVVTGSSEWE